MKEKAFAQRWIRFTKQKKSERVHQWIIEKICARGTKLSYSNCDPFIDGKFVRITEYTIKTEIITDVFEPLPPFIPSTTNRCKPFVDARARAVAEAILVSDIESADCTPETHSSRNKRSNPRRRAEMARRCPGLLQCWFNRHRVPLIPLYFKPRASIPKRSQITGKMLRNARAHERYNKFWNDFDDESIGKLFEEPAPKVKRRHKKVKPYAVPRKCPYQPPPTTIAVPRKVQAGGTCWMKIVSAGGYKNGSLPSISKPELWETVTAEMVGWCLDSIVDWTAKNAPYFQLWIKYEEQEDGDYHIVDAKSLRKCPDGYHSAQAVSEKFLLHCTKLVGRGKVVGAAQQFVPDVAVLQGAKPAIQAAATGFWDYAKRVYRHAKKHYEHPIPKKLPGTDQNAYLPGPSIITPPGPTNPDPGNVEHMPHVSQMPNLIPEPEDFGKELVFPFQGPGGPLPIPVPTTPDSFPPIPNTGFPDNMENMPTFDPQLPPIPKPNPHDNLENMPTFDPQLPPLPRPDPHGNLEHMPSWDPEHQLPPLPRPSPGDNLEHMPSFDNWFQHWLANLSADFKELVEALCNALGDAGKEIVFFFANLRLALVWMVQRAQENVLKFLEAIGFGSWPTLLDDTAKLICDLFAAIFGFTSTLITSVLSVGSWTMLGLKLFALLSHKDNEFHGADEVYRISILYGPLDFDPVLPSGQPEYERRDFEPIGPSVNEKRRAELYEGLGDGKLPNNLPNLTTTHPLPMNTPESVLNAFQDAFPDINVGTGRNPAPHPRLALARNMFRREVTRLQGQLQAPIHLVGGSNAETVLFQNVIHNCAPMLTGRDTYRHMLSAAGARDAYRVLSHDHKFEDCNHAAVLGEDDTLGALVVSMFSAHDIDMADFAKAMAENGSSTAVVALNLPFPLLDERVKCYTDEITGLRYEREGDQLHVFHMGEHTAGYSHNFKKVKSWMSNPPVFHDCHLQSEALLQVGTCVLLKVTIAPGVPEVVPTMWSTQTKQFYILPVFSSTMTRHDETNHIVVPRQRFEQLVAYVSCLDPVDRTFRQVISKIRGLMAEIRVGKMRVEPRWEVGVAELYSLAHHALMANHLLEPSAAEKAKVMLSYWGRQKWRNGNIAQRKLQGYIDAVTFRLNGEEDPLSPDTWFERFFRNKLDNTRTYNPYHLAGEYRLVPTDKCSDQRNYALLGRAAWSAAKWTGKGLHSAAMVARNALHAKPRFAPRKIIPRPAVEPPETPPATRLSRAVLPQTKTWKTTLPSLQDNNDPAPLSPPPQRKRGKNLTDSMIMRTVRMPSEMSPNAIANAPLAPPLPKESPHSILLPASTHSVSLADKSLSHSPVPLSPGAYYSNSPRVGDVDVDPFGEPPVLNLDEPSVIPVSASPDPSVDSEILIERIVRRSGKEKDLNASVAPSAKSLSPVLSAVSVPFVSDRPPNVVVDPQPTAGEPSFARIDDDDVSYRPTFNLLPSLTPAVPIDTAGSKEPLISDEQADNTAAFIEDAIGQEQAFCMRKRDISRRSRRRMRFDAPVSGLVPQHAADHEYIQRFGKALPKGCPGVLALPSDGGVDLIRNHFKVCPAQVTHTLSSEFNMEKVRNMHYSPEPRIQAKFNALVNRAMKCRPRLTSKLLIEGPAMSAKSSLVREFLAREGHSAIVVVPSNMLKLDWRDKCNKLGIKNFCVSRHGIAHITNFAAQYLVIDEVFNFSLPELRMIMTIAGELGARRVIFVGDRYQRERGAIEIDNMLFRNRFELHTSLGMPRDAHAVFKKVNNLSDRYETTGEREISIFFINRPAPTSNLMLCMHQDAKAPQRFSVSIGQSQGLRSKSTSFYQGSNLTGLEWMTKYGNRKSVAYSRHTEFMVVECPIAAHKTIFDFELVVAEAIAGRHFLAQNASDLLFGKRPAQKVESALDMIRTIVSDPVANDCPITIQEEDEFDPVAAKLIEEPVDIQGVINTKTQFSLPDPTSIDLDMLAPVHPAKFSRPPPPLQPDVVRSEFENANLMAAIHQNKSAFDSTKNLFDRNLGTSKLSRITHRQMRHATEYHERFKECYYDSSYVIVPDIDATYNWLAERLAGAVKQLEISEPFGETARSLGVDAEFKTQSKAKPVASFAATLPYGQSILANQKVFNLRFANAQQKAYFNIARMLRPGIILDYGMTDDQLSKRIRDLGLCESFTGPKNLQADVSKQDSSHTAEMLMQFLLTLRDAGVSDEDCELYLLWSSSYKIKSRDEGAVSGQVCFNLGSGDPWTLIRNDVMELLSVCCKYADANNAYIVEKGDDVHGWIDSLRPHRFAGRACFANVILKIDVGAVPYHAGRFHNGKRYLVDPIRAFMKHLTRLPDENVSTDELYRSYISRATDYDPDEVEFLRTATQIMYPFFSGDECAQIISYMVKLRNYRFFRRSYPKKPVAVVLDPKKACLVECIKALRPNQSRSYYRRFSCLDLDSAVRMLEDHCFKFVVVEDFPSPFRMQSRVIYLSKNHCKIRL